MTPPVIVPRANRTLDAVDNFSQAVLDTQIRLFCYRKVVHKRFIDQVVVFLRLQIPRRLRDKVESYLSRKVLDPQSNGQPADAPDAGAFDAASFLAGLMAEPAWQSAERAHPWRASTS